MGGVGEEAGWLLCAHSAFLYLASFHSIIHSVVIHSSHLLLLSVPPPFPPSSSFLLPHPLSFLYYSPLLPLLIPSPSPPTLLPSLPTLLPSFFPFPFLSTLPPHPSLLFVPSSFLSFTCTNCFCCGRHYLGVFILCRIQSSGEDFSDMYGGGTMFTRQPNLLITAYLYILTNST